VLPAAKTLAHPDAGALAAGGELDLVDERKHERDAASTLRVDVAAPRRAQVEGSTVPHLDVDPAPERFHGEVHPAPVGGAPDGVRERLGGRHLQVEELVGGKPITRADVVERTA
jgi:hypothetical protein